MAKRIKRNFVKKDNLNQTKKILAALTAILFIVAIVEFTLFFYSIRYVKVYDIFFRVDNKVGVNVDVNESFINFGIAPPGGSIKKDIIIANNYKKPLVGTVIIEGDIAEFLTIEETFVLQKDEIKNLAAVIYVPIGTPVGDHRGRIIVVFKRAQLF